MNEPKKPKLYLSSPTGFSELGRLGVQSLKECLNKYYNIIDPFEIASEESKIISKLEQLLNNTNFDISVEDIKTKLKEFNTKIGEKNTLLIQEADLVFAILDGADVDSGTASEIGYAFGIKKIIFGFRSDFRYARDNFGSEVNLQVEYFIRASGGKIFQSIAEVQNQLPFQAKANKVNR